jgi:hypothetical protein
MAFLAECLFCKGKVRVSDRALGQTIACPRCGSSFTLAPMANPPPDIQLRKAPAGVAGPSTGANTAPKPAAKPVPKVRMPRPRLAARLGVVSLVLVGAAAVCAAFPRLQLTAFALGAAAAAAGAGARAVAPHRWSPTGMAAMLLSVPVLLAALLGPAVIASWFERSRRPTSLSGPPRGGPVSAVTFDGKPAARTAAWIDAHAFAAEQGGLRVRVLSAVVRPAYSTNASKESPLFLHVQLTLSNVTAEDLLAYAGWGPGKTSAVLRDNRGREYKTQAPPTGGRGRLLVIEPQDSVGDTLLFDPPPDSVDYLRLELPAAAANGEGMLRFEIPKEMIEFPAKPPPPKDAPEDKR